MADEPDETSPAGGPGGTGDAHEAGHRGYRARLSGALGPGAHGRVDPVSRAGHMEYDRILFFTDAVFAIAITLLIVDLPAKVEHAVNHKGTTLAPDWSGVLGFAISFAVVALFWLAHHSTFRYIKAIDRPLMLLNLLFLGFIAFLPYPTELLSATADSHRSTVVFYAVCAGGAGLLETVCWYYAMRAGLVQGLDRASQLLFLFRAARVPVAFGISIPIAYYWSARAAAYFWIAIAASGWLINSAYDRLTRGQPPAEPVDG